MFFKLKLKTLQNVRGSAGHDTRPEIFNHTEEQKNRGKLMAGVASRWSPVSLHVKLESATQLPAIERIKPHSRGGLLQPCPLCQGQSWLWKLWFQNTYQIYPFVTSQFITTLDRIFNSVTQECKLMWSAILLIITVGEQMGPCICKYLISDIVVVCLWKYPVWLWNHTACFGLYNDVCCCDSCIRRISPSVLIILHHSAQFWALNLASQWNTVTATHNCLFFQFSTL